MSPSDSRLVRLGSRGRDGGLAFSEAALALLLAVAASADAADAAEDEKDGDDGK